MIAGARAGKLGGTRFIFFLYDLLSVVLKVDADGLVILMPNINPKAVSSAAPAEIIPPRAMKLSEKCSLLSQPLLRCADDASGELACRCAAFNGAREAPGCT